MKTRSNLRYSFKQTVPVLFGYLCLGGAFGIMLADKGYSFVWAFFIALTCYSGSMQFVLVSLLSSNPPVTLIYTAVMTLIVNSRHIFYGLSFIQRFKEMGIRGLYMIFSLTDETYSLLCAQTSIPSNLDERSVFFNIAWLNQLYWICGCVIGTLIGTLIPFDFTGVDFTMTALFVVIFIEQWKTVKSHIPAMTGLVVAALCLICIGSDNFMFFALAFTSLILVLMRSYFEKNGKTGEKAEEDCNDNNA